VLATQDDIRAEMDVDLTEGTSPDFTLKLAR
jgi:hypothetical protein